MTSSDPLGLDPATVRPPPPVSWPGDDVGDTGRLAAASRLSIPHCEGRW